MNRRSLKKLVARRIHVGCHECADWPQTREAARYVVRLRAAVTDLLRALGEAFQVEINFNDQGGTIMNEHLKMLGFKMRDRITGVEGVITSVSFDLYGCVQGLMNRGPDKDGKLQDNYWFDMKRLDKVGDEPVMVAPDFQDARVLAEVPGGEALPGFTTQPAVR